MIRPNLWRSERCPSGRWSALALGWLCLGVSLVACTNGSSSPPSTGSTTSQITSGGHGLTWIFGTRALDDMTIDPVALSVLRNGKVYQLLGNGDRPSTQLPVIPTLSFASEAGLAAAAAGGRIPPYVKAVLFDYEDWKFTPTLEQRNPAPYVKRAAEVAHTHGWVYLVSPALDLAKELQPSTSSAPAAYLELDLAGSASAVADVIDIQAQSTERSGSSYFDLVSAAARQARKTNPQVVVIAGLSTNPTGGPVTLAELEASVSLTRSLVDGYWLNIPIAGAICPGCGVPDPALGIALLHWIANQHS